MLTYRMHMTYHGPQEVKRMTQKEYRLFEDYMLSSMRDSAHDSHHVYRVLYTALDIASAEENVDKDVLICACLLHDVGRAEQFENPALCHAQVGAQKAQDFLLGHGYAQDFALAVRHCIASHRFRSDAPPASLEAKILFDADKLDVSGAMGIARTLLYQGNVGEPLYTLSARGEVECGQPGTDPSFFQEYKFKLETIYDKFYTRRGGELARQRKQAAVSFHDDLLHEVKSTYGLGKPLLHAELAD